MAPPIDLVENSLLYQDRCRIALYPAGVGRYHSPDCSNQVLVNLFADVVSYVGRRALFFQFRGAQTGDAIRSCDAALRRNKFIVVVYDSTGRSNTFHGTDERICRSPG